MVAVVSGSGLGLFNSSAAGLGNVGVSGNGNLGQAKEQVYVNSATGNLVIQHQDELTTATGLDLGVIRTYNSQGKLDDDNGDNWKIGLYRRIYGLTGTVNTAGSAVTKVFGDGAEATYTYDTTLAKYVSSDGDGAHDTLAWSAANSQWIWTDGAARNTEAYDSAGKLLNSKDVDGNAVTYAYTGILLTSVADTSGQITFLDYTGNNLTQIRVVSNSVTQTLTRYTYDASSRLSAVTIDLSPSDNVITDNNTYVTTYTYDGTSKRVASITQKDGTSVAFTYQLIDGVYRVKTYTDGNGNVTTLNYTQPNGAGTQATQLTAQGLYTTEQQTVTVPAYYLVQAGNTWASITQAVYGTSNANAIAALQSATGNPSLSTGLHLTVPASLIYSSGSGSTTATANGGVLLTTEQQTVTVPAYYLVQAGNTWASITQAIYGTSDANAIAALQAALGNPSLSTGLHLTVPTSLTYTPVASSTTVTANSGVLSTTNTTSQTYNVNNAALSTTDTVTQAYNLNAGALTSGGGAAVAHAQSTSTYSDANNNITSVSATYTNAQTAGNLNVVVIGWTNHTQHIASVTDSRGNVYTLAVEGDPAWVRQSVYYAKNIVGSAAGTNTVTVTFTGDVYFPDLRIAEYSGIDAINPIDVVANSSGWGGVGSASIITTNANDLLVVGNYVPPMTTSWDINYVQRVYTAGGDVLGDRLTTSTGSYSVSLPQNGSGNWHVQMVAFRAASSGAPYYAVPANATWQSIANTLYGVNSAAAGTALQTAMGNPALTTGTHLMGLPATLNVTTTTTVAAYYAIPASASWQSIANAVYGVNSAAAGTALQTAMGGGALPVAGTHLTGLPATLTITTTTTVPAYYLVQAGNTWSSITQAIYGTSNANAIAALQAATGNPTLSTGLHLTIPSTLTYTTSGSTTANANSGVLSTTDTTSQSYNVNNAALSTTDTVNQAYSLNTSLLTGGGASVASYAQGTYLFTDSSNPSSTSATFANAQTVGNLNVIVIGWCGGQSITSVTDTQGNVYTLAVQSGPGWMQQAVYYAKNIKGSAAGANTVTVTFDGALAYPDLRIAEYSGISTTDPIDAAVSFYGYGNSASASLTTTNANDLLVGVNFVSTSTASIDPGYVQRLYTDGLEVLVDRVTTSAGNYSLTLPLDSAGDSIVQMVAFRAASSGGAAYYSVPAGATWQSIANTLYGVNSAAAGTALQTAMGNPALTTGTHLMGLPATLNVTTTTTVAAYYAILASASWQSIANAVYGVNSAAAGTALQTAMGGGALPVAGTHLTGLPATLTISTTSTVPAYYTVPAGASWASITQAVYGTSNASAIAALQSATGNPTLTTGLHLTVPASLTYISGSTTGSANSTVLSATDTQTTNTSYNLNAAAVSTTDTQTTTNSYDVNSGALTTPTPSWATAAQLDSTSTTVAAADPEIQFDGNGNGFGIFRTASDVVVRRYDKASNTWGAATVLDPNTTTVSRTSLSVDATGNALVAWVQSTGGAASAYARRYDAATSTWATAVLVETTTDVVATSAGAVTTSINGTYAAVGWIQTIGSEANLYVARYNGSTWVARELVDSQTTAASIPKMAIDAQGNVSIVWQQNNGAETVSSVWSNRYSVATATWGTAAQLDSTSTTVAAADPEIQFDGNGNGFGIFRTASDVVVRRYDKASNTWGAATVLDPNTTTVSRTSLSVDATGNALVAWVQSTGGAASAYARRYDAATSTWATAVLVETTTDVVATSAGAVTTSINGTYAAVGWIQTIGSEANLYVARYNGSTWVARELVDSQTTAASIPKMAIDAQGNVSIVWQQNNGAETVSSVWSNRYTNASGAPYYTIPASSTWQTVANTLYGVNSPEAGAALQAAMGNITLPASNQPLTGMPATLFVTTTTTITVPAYYTIPASAIWQSVANTLYGVNSAAAGAALQAAMGGISLPAQNSRLTNLPATLTVTTNTTITVPAYYLVQGTDNWTTITQTVYGTSDVNAVAALQTAAGNPTLATGFHLTVPSTLTYSTSGGTTANANGGVLSTTDQQTVTVPAYYFVPAGATWASITQAVYGTSAADAITALQTATGNPALSTGLHLTVPSTLTYTTSGSTTANANSGVLSTTEQQMVTVPAYYLVPAGATWASITQAVYGTSDASAITALQTAAGNPALTTGLHLPLPVTLAYGGGTTTLYLQTDVVDSLNQTTTYTQDAAGRLTSVLSPTVSGVRLTTQYAYDTSGNLTSVTQDPSGLNRVTTFQYDTSGNLLLSRDATGDTVSRTYSANNQLLTETTYVVADPDGAGAGQPSAPMTSRYAYDVEDHLRFTVSADGRVTEYRYNTAGQRIAKLTFVGSIYDVSTLAPTATLSEETLTAWVNLGTTDKTKVERIDYTYDFRGNLSAETAYAQTDVFGLGSFGSNGLGYRRTSYTYDQRGLLLSHQIEGDATLSATSALYDGLGRVLNTYESGSIANSNSQQAIKSANYIYEDFLHRNRVDEYFYDSQTTRYTRNIFDLAGQIKTVSISTAGWLEEASTWNLGTMAYSYDADDRLRMITGPADSTSAAVRQYLIYDTASRKVADIDGDGTLTEYVYDGTNQLIKTIRYADRFTSATLATLVDGQGKPTNVTLTTLKAALPTTVGRASDQITRTVYDAAGRLVYSIDPVGAVTQSFYDGAGRVASTVAYTNPVTIASSVDELRPVATQLVAVNVLTVRTFNNTAGVSQGSLNIDNANDRRTRNFYDNDGHLIGTLDGAGYLVEYLYDAAGHLSKQIGYANQANSSLWSSGTLAQLRPATDTETTIDYEQDIVSYFFYDRMGRQTAILDAEGYLTETVYDLSRYDIQTIRYQKPVDYNSGYTLDTLRSSATGQNQTTSYKYDGLKRLVQATNYEGTVTTYTYDAAGHLISSTRASGTSEARTTQTQYDLLGRLIKELSGEGSTAIAGGMAVTTAWDRYGISYTYDAAGRRLSATNKAYDPSTGVTQANATFYYYNEDGQLRFTVNALGERTENRYNALGQLTDSVQYINRISTAGLTGGLLTAALTTSLTGNADSTEDAKTTYTYKLTGQLDTSLTAEGAQVSRTYNAFGEAISSTEKLNASQNTIHSYIYDQRGMLKVTRWDPAGINRTATNTYDAFGRLSSTTDQYGNVTKAEYDRLGRTIATYDALNNKRVTTYDAFSRTLTTRDALNNVTTYSYNDSARSMTLTTPENISVTTVHNRHGQTLSVTANGNTTSYTYDVDGRVKTATDSMGTLENHGYDTVGRQISVTDARGIVSRFAYDAANRVLTRTEDAGLGTNPITGVAYLNLTTAYTYNGEGRITQVAESNGKITTTAYDRDGRVTDITVGPGVGTSPATTTHYTYDNAGHVITVTEGYGSANPRQVQYIYDVLGRRSEEIVKNTRVDNAIVDLHTLYKYDANGNLTRKIDAKLNSTWHVYDKDSRLIQTIDSLGGVTQTNYDGESRVIATRRYASAVNTAVLGDIVAALSVNYAAQDRVTQSVYDRDGRQTYTIDAMGGVIERTYDAGGNVIRSRAYANAIVANTYASTAAVSNALTVAGNNVNTLSANDRVQWTAYDIRNRAVFQQDGAGAVTQYKYDADGNVVAKIDFATPRSTALATDVNALQSWANQTSITNNASNHTTRYWYDSTDRLRFSLDAEGYLTQTQYNDAARQQVTTAYAVKPVTLGNATTPPAIIANANDQTTTIQYDYAGRSTRVTDATQINYEEYTYDAVGNKIGYVNKKGDTWTYIYDANRRLIEERSPPVDITTVTDAGASLQSTLSNASIVTRMTYDALGNVVTRTEGIQRLANGSENTTNARTTSYTYDTLGRQLRTTYPPMRVYNAGAGNTQFGNGAAINPTETPPQNLYSEVAYDSLGNAFRNQDVAGSYSYKIYDNLGRIQYEVDAKNNVTSHTYDTFGNQLTLTRYAKALSSALPTNSGAIVATDVTDRLTAIATQDRTITTAYDRLNRVIQVTQPAVTNFQPSVASSGGTIFTAGATTLSEYDAFGQVMRSRNLVMPAANGNPATYADTYYYYDKRGLKSASVDALGYLTTYRYDETGDLIDQIEYAAAITYWNTTEYTAPSQMTADDREVAFVYDRLNRKISETVLGVRYSLLSGNGPSSATTGEVGNQVTTYGYDAVGNQTRTTTANGANTYSYYDALGRITAIAEPSRDRDDGTTLMPLTLMRRDAYGNLVEQISYANGTASASEGANNFSAPLTSTSDRSTKLLLDVYGHALRTEDANGADRFASYNERGEVVKEWQPVTNNSGSTDYLVTIYEYDRLGHQTAIIEPQRYNGAATVTVTRHSEYNAFGEIIAKGIVDGSASSGQQEYFEYDQAGRVWRTNSGDGVVKVYAYDLAGNATAEIKSRTRDLATAVGNVTDAFALPGADQMRTETRYDLLGRVREQREASFAVANALQPIGGLFSFGTFATPNPPDAIYAQYDGYYFISPTTWENGGGWRQVSPPDASNPYGRYERVDQSSYSLTQAGHIYWNMPSELNLAKTFEYRINNSNSAWSSLTINQLNDTQVGVNLSALGNNNYEYRVSYARKGITGVPDAPHARATGTFSVSNSNVTTLSTNTTSAVSGVSLYVANHYGSGVTVIWAASDAAVAATFEIRLLGSSTWQSYSVPYQFYYGPYYSVNLDGYASGNFEYRITHTLYGRTVALGSGTLNLALPVTTTTGSNAPDAPWSPIPPLSAWTSTEAGAITLARANQMDPNIGEEYFYYRLLGTSDYVHATVNVVSSLVYVTIPPLAPGTYEYITFEGYTGYGGYWNGTGSQGQFVFDGSSTNIISQYGYAPYPDTAPLTVVPPVVTTTIQWPLGGFTGATSRFNYRPVGSDTWQVADISASGGTSQISVRGLTGEYEYFLSYGYYAYPSGDYFDSLVAQGRFVVSGNSAVVTSQSNWTYAGGTASYLPGVITDGSKLSWSAAPQTGDIINVTYYNTVTGASGSLLPQTANGSDYWVNFFGLTSGNYRYQISYYRGVFEYLRGSGEFNVSTNVSAPTAGISNPTTPGQVTGFADYNAVSGYLVWSTPAEVGAGIAFRYRPAGSTTWVGTLSWWAWAGGYAVDVSNLYGPIDYEVSYTRAGQSTPYMIGGGTVAIAHSITTTASISDNTVTTLQAQTVTPNLSQIVDRWGNVIASTDAMFQTTNYRYNQRNQLEQVLQPTTDIVATAGGIATYRARPETRNHYDLFGRLIATTDANGKVNQVSYNAANQVITEIHADGGVKRYTYDAFGEQVQVVEQVQVGEELGYRTRNQYDKVGNLQVVAKEVELNGFATNNPFDLSAANVENVISYSYCFDEAGRRIRETTGEYMNDGTTPETIRYWYDLQGNIVQRRTPRGFDIRYAYDAQGNKTQETDAENGVMNWAYNYFGRLSQHTDLGTTVTSYGYDYASLLTVQSSSIGQYITYTYDTAGHLTKITDFGVARDTELSYDAAGRRIRERTVIDGLVHEDTQITYDELGRVKYLSDPQYRDSYSYDAQGNRTHISATYLDHSGVLKNDDLWYTYDAMNRVQISQGRGLMGGAVAIDTTPTNAQGIELTYNLRGDRIGSKQYASVLGYWYASYTGLPIGTPSGYSFAWTESAGIDQQKYDYDGLGRLKTTQRYVTKSYSHTDIGNGTSSYSTSTEWVTTDSRQYDGASRQIAQANYFASGINYEGLNSRTSATSYDDDGRIDTQLTLRNGIKESYVIYKDSISYPGGSVTWTSPFGDGGTVGWAAGWTPGFDKAGNLRGYIMRVYNTNTPDPNDVAYTSTFSTKYRAAEGYQEIAQDVSSDSVSGPQSGHTSRTYNVNGELVQFTDERDQNKNRYFANNAMAQAVTVVQGRYDGQGGRPTLAAAFSDALQPNGVYNLTKSQHFFSANGQMVGSFGQLTENGQFAANFDVNFTPVSNNYPGTAPSEIVAQKGDTLRSIAARVWGDATLWYLIAEENGRTDPNAEIETGTVLRIPNEVVSMKNDAGTFKPFSVQDAIGDTTPTQPAPPQPAGKKGCGIIGTIIIIVVAIVVTWLSWGTGTGWAASLGSSIGGTGAAGTAIGAGIAAAAGSVASQVVGIAIGAQDSFSWKAVAAAALTAGITKGLGIGSLSPIGTDSTALYNVAAQGIANSAVNQGVNIALGLQDKFSWRDVAISAVAAPIANKVGGFVGDKVQGMSSAFAKNLSVNLAQGVSSTVVRSAFGGRVDFASVLADAFGNAIGNSIVDASKPKAVDPMFDLGKAYADQGALQSGGATAASMDKINASMDNINRLINTPLGNNPDADYTPGSISPDQFTQALETWDRAAYQAKNEADEFTAQLADVLKGPMFAENGRPAISGITPFNQVKELPNTVSAVKGMPSAGNYQIVSNNEVVDGEVDGRPAYYSAYNKRTGAIDYVIGRKDLSTFLKSTGNFETISELQAGFDSAPNYVKESWGAASSLALDLDVKSSAGHLLYSYLDAATDPNWLLQMGTSVAGGMLARSSSMTLPNNTIGWKVGDPLNNLTAQGKIPSWDAVRSRIWKNEAYYNAKTYSGANVARMETGLAPQRINPTTGKIESMELNHVPPQRDGGLFDVHKVWPEEHAAVDPYRKLKK